VDPSKAKLLKLYTGQVRAAGYEVTRGGGWIRLAAAIGVTCQNKGQARAALRDRFPDIPEPVRSPKVRKLRKAKPEKVTGNDFLLTYEWRRVRMEALKKYGARCQCCGATPATGAVMNVDHIKPRKLFPQLALDVNNLQVLCNACNHGKGNWDMTDWRDEQPDLTPEQASHLNEIMKGD
jgi:5-methylcytosine-specific restriction endonuclease McrA